MSIGNDGSDEKEMPAHVSPAERAAHERTQSVAQLLDNAIPIPGTDYRIGLDPLIGILPVSGDVVTGVIGLYIVAEAGLVGAPRNVLARMLGNILVDVAIGSIPAVGALFDAAWKANVRNVELFEEHLRGKR